MAQSQALVPLEGLDPRPRERASVKPKQHVGLSCPYAFPWISGMEVRQTKLVTHRTREKDSIFISGSLEHQGRLQGSGGELHDLIFTGQHESAAR